jgi:hypothetical protein
MTDGGPWLQQQKAGGDTAAVEMRTKRLLYGTVEVCIGASDVDGPAAKAMSSAFSVVVTCQLMSALQAYRHQ